MKAAPSTLDLTPNLNREASPLESRKIMPQGAAQRFAAQRPNSSVRTGFLL